MQRVLVATIAIAVVLCGCSKKSDTSTETVSSTTAEPSSSPEITASAQASPAQTPSPAGPPSAAASGAAGPKVTATATATPNALSTVHFDDIAGIPAENAIKQVAALGIFGTKTGKFRPDGRVTRSQYIEWLVTANNIYFKNNDKGQIRLANSSSEQSFVDVPKTYPGFAQIEGMADAGYVIGVNKNHFAPTRPLTREELVAIQVARYMGGSTVATDPKKGIEQYYCGPVFTDKNQISKPYWGAFNTDQCTGFSGQDDLHRIFGSMRTVHPQRPVTRAEVAIALQKIAGVTAAQALGMP